MREKRAVGEDSGELRNARMTIGFSVRITDRSPGCLGKSPKPTQDPVATQNGIWRKMAGADFGRKSHNPF